METNTSDLDVDLEAQTCQGTISSSRDLSSVRKSSSAERRDSHEPDPEVPDEIELPGIRGLAAYERDDLTNMTRRAFIEASNYCQIAQEQDIERLWGELKEAIAAKNPQQTQLTKQTRKEIEDYHKFFLQVRQIGASDQPDRRSLMRYLETAHDKLSGEPPQDRDFLVDTSDWIRGFSMEAYESSLNQIINYRFGRFLLRPSRWKKRQDGTRTYEFYGRVVIQVLLYGVFIGVVGVFLGIPVVISTMDVTTKSEQAAIYFVFLIVFTFLAKALLKGFQLPLIAILAYAAVLCGSSRLG